MGRFFQGNQSGKIVVNIDVFRRDFACRAAPNALKAQKFFRIRADCCTPVGQVFQPARPLGSSTGKCQPSPNRRPGSRFPRMANAIPRMGELDRGADNTWIPGCPFWHGDEIFGRARLRPSRRCASAESQQPRWAAIRPCRSASQRNGFRLLKRHARCEDQHWEQGIRRRLGPQMPVDERACRKRTAVCFRRAQTLSSARVTTERCRSPPY
jgi:hypothetical protein